jgi:hypothetical protein
MLSALSLLLVAQTSTQPQRVEQLASSPPPDTGSRAHVDFRVAAGEEWDSNARRVITGDVGVLQGASLPSGPVVADGLTRLLVDTQGALLLAPEHQLRLGYVLGAKRFNTYGTEDLIVQDLSASTQHGLLDWLSASTSGTLRASRIRSGTRDYTLGNAGLNFYAHAGPYLTFGAGGAFTGFDFRPEERLSYKGPTVGGDVTLRPFARLSIMGRFDYTWRKYKGNALVPGQTTDSSGNPITVVTFCDGKDDAILPPSCTPRSRLDTEAAVALRAAYRGRVVIGGEYLLRIQRSTSDLENIDRHRLSAYATIPLPFDFIGNALAALQLNSGTSITQTKFLAEDDENQNSVQVQISRMITDALSAELRYALFANQFSTAPVSFLRQTVYFGLSYRIGA